MKDEGVVTAKGVAERLRAEGAEISDDAVGRWIKTIKRPAMSRAAMLIHEHVDATVPADLAALEEMEATCLRWAREDAESYAARVADASVSILGHIQSWRAMLLDSNVSDETKVRHMIKFVAAQINTVSDEQTRKLAAIRRASDIIELKLRQAGLLDAERDTPIVFAPTILSNGDGQQSPDGSASFGMDEDTETHGRA